jgi:hypothetical protein
MRNLLFASILLVSSSIFGADKFFSQETGATDLTLDGPISATIGELVELEAGDIPYSGAPSWVMVQPPKKGGWKVFTSSREDGISKKDNHFVFSTPYPGKYCVVFSFTIIDAKGMKPEGVTESNLKTQSIIHWINVTALDEKPEPEPQPDKPEPKPEPKPEDPGKYGFLKLAKEWAALIPEPQKSRRSDVSAAFESVAAQIAAGTIKDMDEIIQKTASAIRNKMPDQKDRDVWNKGFMSKLSGQLEVLDSESKLNTLDNYRECWAEISRGLK